MNKDRIMFKQLENILLPCKSLMTQFQSPCGLNSFALAATIQSRIGCVSNMDMLKIKRLLMQLGTTATYRGFPQVAFAVSLAAQDSEMLNLVTKHLYPTVAKQYGTSWRAVERNIRTVINTAWQRNPTLLCQLAGYPLKKKPSVSQFIAILAANFSFVET